MSPPRRALMSLSAGTVMTGASTAGASPSPLQGEASVTDFGARGDGETDDTAAFERAAAAGAAVLIPAGGHVLKGSVMFAGPVRFAYGALLRGGPGAVLTFRGGLAAGLHAIFALSEGARVVFEPGTISHGYPEWWG